MKVFLHISSPSWPILCGSAAALVSSLLPLRRFRVALPPLLFLLCLCCFNLIFITAFILFSFFIYCSYILHSYFLSVRLILLRWSLVSEPNGEVRILSVRIYVNWFNGSELMYSNRFHSCTILLIYAVCVWTIFLEVQQSNILDEWYCSSKSRGWKGSKAKVYCSNKILRHNTVVPIG